MTALPSASVVIATRSRPELLERCLEGVARQDTAPLETLVVDTAGDAATRKVALAAGARYLVEPAAGIARARNRGARASSHDIVAYLDDDAVPESDWLSALLVEFSDPLAAAVSGRILALAGQPNVPPMGVIYGGPTRLVVSRSTADWFERASFGGVGQGANLAVRRSVFDSWPGFDERRGQGTRMAGMEEHHAFFSLVDRGFHVVYTPAAKVRHPYPRTQAELRVRHLSQLTAASYHLALMLVEDGRYRRRTATYALGAIRGKRRPWRDNLGPASPAVHGWEVALARFRGLGLYLAGRLESGPSQDPSEPSV